jgi:hypothetical protein
MWWLHASRATRITTKSKAPQRRVARQSDLPVDLLTLVGALTQQFTAYRMVIVGGAICAAGVFIMALPTAWFQPAVDSGIGQWLGHSYLSLQGNIHPYYIMTAIYIAIFSVGEAFYSPRVYEYAAAIAPRGQEASYGALSYIPFLLGKLLVGSAGWLLVAFCPEHGPRNSGMMWLIFALAASVTIFPPRLAAESVNSWSTSTRSCLSSTGCSRVIKFLPNGLPGLPW